MRPFTRIIFEQKGKTIVGSRWTEEQVRQAYEKADDLLDCVSKYKSFKPVQELGIDHMNLGFEDGLRKCMVRGQPDQAVQSLSLSIFSELLEAGKKVLMTAAYSYKCESDKFKSLYASSKQAFLKDRFLFQKVPTFSFSPFKTGDNPLISRDEKLSEICVGLYSSPVYEESSKEGGPLNYRIWLHSSAGNRFSKETEWLQKLSSDMRQKMLGQSNITSSAILPRSQNTL